VTGCGSSSPTGLIGSPPPGSDSGAIHVLSNRADLISAGDALVEIVGAGSSPKVMLNGADISSQFAMRPNGRVMGLVTGLNLGQNTLTAAGSTATITNYPNSGPIFSGPRIPRLRCQDGAVDTDCNQPVEYSYLYKSTDPTATSLLPYDPANPPSDVATTTTDDGVTMPFVVRLELGYQDRDQYKILTLFTPDADWQPWAPQPQWNRKVLITHGGNCGADYTTGTAPLNDYSGTIPENPVFEQSYITALGRGFMVMSTALDNTGHNCDIPLGAESLMMAKERLVEQYGELRYTIGTGCSGGSIAQATIANSYPGIYQGLLTMCSYPDTFSAGLQFTDLHLLRLYFEDPTKWAPGVIWTPLEWGDIEGHIAGVNAIAADELLYKAATAPTGDCYGDQTYHPVNNPGGVRCSIIDWMPEIFGTREPEVWSPMEQAAGHGFTGVPLGNIGVQYGLEALRLGRITPAQFVDLNAQIGGLDVDIQPVPQRIRADRPALGNAYRSGTVNMTNNMNTVAVINFLGPDPGIAHDSVHAYWTRRRLDREHGGHGNHVMWAGPAPLIGDPNFVYLGLTAMDRWLAAIEQDTSDRPLSEKIVLAKPADIYDRCTDGAGHELVGDPCVQVVEPIYAYGTPRTVAGDTDTADNFECVLRPFSREFDYGLLPFTEDQWATLEATFADGVCDYSLPGVDKQPTIPWLTYQDAGGAMIVGGVPLPAAPAGSREGWSSAAFR
jgi:hypothetical protein